ncbi:MAG: Ig-like domain-containing protein [Clostridia bacterium]|nr:Ig-like domain-containing protein [Clostridia bacterium]
MKKRQLSILLSIILALPNIIPAAASEQEFYPDASYSINDDLGENGKWKYRELFVHTTCDDPSQIPSDGSYAGMAVANDGERTYYEKTAEKYKKIGVAAEELHANVDYIFSGYVKSDSACDLGMLGGVYIVFDSDGNRLSSGANDMSVAGFKSLTEWQRIDKTFKFTQYKGRTDGKTYDIPEGGYISNGAEWRKEIFITHSNSSAVTLGLDDISLRLVPDEGKCTAYTKSASTIENPVISATDEISFTFSNDIDMRTVTPETVLLNGTAYDSTEIRSTVDEETRETTVYIKFNVLSAEQSYSVELSGIKDAWGRDIVGTNKTDFATLPAVEQTDAAFEDEDNQPLTSLAAGKVTASVALKSNIGDVNANIIAAECDGNRIVEIQYLPVTITASETRYTLPALDIDSADNAVRVYVWSDSEFPTPYTRYGIFSKNGYSAAQY